MRPGTAEPSMPSTEHHHLIITWPGTKGLSSRYRPSRALDMLFPRVILDKQNLTPLCSPCTIRLAWIGLDGSDEVGVRLEARVIAISITSGCPVGLRLWLSAWRLGVENNGVYDE